MAGPFKDLSNSRLQISHFGVIPNHNQVNKWRLNIDLSYPKHHTANGV